MIARIIGAPVPNSAVCRPVERPPAVRASQANALSSAPAQRGPAAIRHIWHIARKQFSDRLRSGWLLACIAVWLGAIGLTSFFGLVQVGRLGVQGYERTVVSLLSLVQFLAPLLGLLIGHDLVAGEREERTLALVLASGVSRARLVLGKFLGGCMAVTFPLGLGFAIAGTVIGLVAQDKGLTSFLLLAASGLALGLVFVGLGLAISAVSRTRVQALVMALLTWCGAVFVFDLVALGLVLSTQTPGAAQEIEVVCDATHVNAAADLHSAYESPADAAPESAGQAKPHSFSWLLINPVDAFRAINLAGQIGAPAPWGGIAMSCGGWLIAALGVSIWKLNRSDL